MFELGIFIILFIALPLLAENAQEISDKSTSSYHRSFHNLMDKNK